MFSKIANVIIKRPVKILLFTIVFIFISVIGMSKIELATGNDTLIQPNTDVYKENQALEDNFGSDPIIILYEATDVKSLLTLQHIEKIESLDTYLAYNDNVFSITSPVTVLKQMSAMQYQKFQSGLTEIVNALALSGTNLKSIVENLDNQKDSEHLDEKIDQLIEAQQALYSATNNLVSGYENTNNSLTEILDSLNTLSTDDPSALEDIKDNLSQLSSQIINLITSSENLPEIPNQTITALQTIQTKLNELDTNQQTLGNQLDQLGNHLLTMSENLNTMLQYSDVMEPSIPKKQGTLDFMIYDDNQSLKPMFRDFIIDNRYMMVSIKLKENTTDKDKEEIINSIKQIMDDESITISGKPVLDLSIKTSMKTSMQNMMLLSIISMVIVLSITFKVKWRLFPLIMILVAVIGTIGLMGWISIPITMVSMAVFPILIGLGIDYGIQFQSRYTEETEVETYE